MNACKPGGTLDGHVLPVLGIASRGDALGIKRLRDAGMNGNDILIISPRDFGGDSLRFGEALLYRCHQRGVTIFGQYGWMVKTPANFIEVFPGMGINQHPAPLSPGNHDFGGKGMFGRRCHFARLNFVRRTKHDFWTSAVAQRVHPEYDKGAILMEWRVPILSDDSVEKLAERVLPMEHRVQIETLRSFAKNNVHETAGTELVKPSEVSILEEVRREAILAYPHG